MDYFDHESEKDWYPIEDSDYDYFGDYYADEEYDYVTDDNWACGTLQLEDF